MCSSGRTAADEYAPADGGPINAGVVKSALALPRPAELPAGSNSIAGFAYSPSGPVQRVEWSADDGTTWQAARILDPVLPHAWQRFQFEWDSPAGSHTLLTRATDRGRTESARSNRLQQQGIPAEHRASSSGYGELERLGELKSAEGVKPMTRRTGVALVIGVALAIGLVVITAIALIGPSWGLEPGVRERELAAEFYQMRCAVVTSSTAASARHSVPVCSLLMGPPSSSSTTCDSQCPMRPRGLSRTRSTG